MDRQEGSGDEYGNKGPRRPTTDTAPLAGQNPTEKQQRKEL